MKHRRFTLLFIVASRAGATACWRDLSRRHYHASSSETELCPNGHIRRAIRFSEPHARLGYAPVFWIYLLPRPVPHA